MSTPPSIETNQKKSYRFSKQERLLTAADFKNIFNASPLRIAHPSLLILAKPNDLGTARLGLIIAKKHVKKAVRRNRLKRLIRESFRTHPLPEIDVIVLARSGADIPDNTKIISILNDLWKRVSKKHSKMGFDTSSSSHS